MQMHSNSDSGGLSVADGIVRILLIGLALIAPIFLIPLQYVTLPQGKVLLIASVFIVALLIWAFARIAEGVVHVPKSALVYVSLLLPVAYLVSTIVAGWSGVSLVGEGIEQDTLAAVVLMSALFLLITFSFYGNVAAIRLLIQSAVVGFIALFALDTLFIFFPEWFSLGVLSGKTANPFGSWHDLGILSGLCFFLAFALWNSDIFEGWKRAFIIALGAFALFFLVVIHFSDVFWATSALFLLAGLSVIRSALSSQGCSMGEAVKKGTLWLAVAVVFGIAAYSGASVWDKLPGPIQIVQTEVRPSWRGTLDIARQSLQAPSEFVFGAGPNSFIREWGLHKPTSVNATPFWDSDFNYGVGIIPTSIFTSGAIGLIAWAALILVMLAMFYRFTMDRRSPLHGRSIFGVALLSVTYLVAYHMIYTPGTALTTATFIALGMLAIFSMPDHESRAIPIGTSGISDMIRLLAVVIAVFAAVLAAGIMARQVLSNIFVNKSAVTYQATSDPMLAGGTLQNAFLISPNNDRAHRAAAELGIIELSRQLSSADPKDDAATAQLRNTLQTTIQHGLSAVSINGSNYQNWLLLAQVYGNLAGANIEGAYEQAQNAYDKASQAHPTNPVPKFRLAQLAVAKNDVQSARDNLNEAIKLKPDFAAAYFLLSQVEAADGKGDVAVQAALAAAQLVPQDPLGWFNLGYILYASKSYSDAATALQEAIRLAPDYSNALFFFGLSLNQLNMKNEAAQVFDRIAQLNPNETWITQMAANVRAGKDPMEGINTGAAGQ